MIIPTTRFKKDLKKLKKQNRNLEELEYAIGKWPKAGGKIQGSQND